MKATEQRQSDWSSVRRGVRVALVYSLAFLAAGLISRVAASNDDVFEPYRIILERQPFGREPPPPPLPERPEPPPPPPIPPQKSFARDLRLTFIIRNDHGDLRIGIINEHNKKTYFMEVGDVEDEMTLLEIDYESERALLRHGDQEAWLAMDGQTPETGRVGSMTPTQSSPPSRPQGTTSRYRRPATQPPQPTLTREEYERTRAERPPPRPPREVLANAQAERRQGAPDVDGLSPEEREQVLREYNLELIRAGGSKGPPLPIQLTDEEDAQLVEEGVLPPME